MRVRVCFCEQHNNEPHANADRGRRSVVVVGVRSGGGVRAWAAGGVWRVAAVLWDGLRTVGRASIVMTPGFRASPHGPSRSQIQSTPATLEEYGQRPGQVVLTHILMSLQKEAR